MTIHAGDSVMITTPGIFCGRVGEVVQTTTSIDGEMSRALLKVSGISANMWFSDYEITKAEKKNVIQFEEGDLVEFGPFRHILYAVTKVYDSGDIDVRLAGDKGRGWDKVPSGSFRHADPKPKTVVCPTCGHPTQPA